MRIRKHGSVTSTSSYVSILSRGGLTVSIGFAYLTQVHLGSEILQFQHLGQKKF